MIIKPNQQKNKVTKQKQNHLAVKNWDFDNIMHCLLLFFSSRLYIVALIKLAKNISHSWCYFITWSNQIWNSTDIAFIKAE